MAKRPAKPKFNPADAAELMDALELIMGEGGGKLPDLGGRMTALERAQDIMWDAFDTSNKKKRAAMAREALAISPDCADGYYLLAREVAKTGAERLALFRKAVDAGAKGLGKKAFKEDVGHFWGLVETRPYMRALQGLAEELGDQGQGEECVAVYAEMLRLNPNDNQGVRYELLNRLLAYGKDTQAKELVKAYKNDGAAWWLYGKALLAFRAKGDSAAARRALAEAVTGNPFAPDYLTGAKPIPKRLQAYYSPGDDSEAIEVALNGKAAWLATPGAAEWLARAGVQARVLN
jgi:tetratricopeptide (TPR) repeat protein